MTIRPEDLLASFRRHLRAAAKARGRSSCTARASGASAAGSSTAAASRLLHPILTDDEIAALLKTCAVTCGRADMFDRAIFLGRRDEVVLRLLLDTGVRVSELCGLALTDVHLDRELAYVTPPPSSAPTTPTDVS